MWKWIIATVVVMAAGSAHSGLVSAGFVIPESLEHSSFRLAPLTQQHAEADYAAVMASRTELRALFGGDWPADDFSLADNRQDIADHEAQAAAVEAFTYTVLDPAGELVLGCLYIVPSESPSFDAAYIFWLRTGHEALEQSLAAAIAGWLNDAWPFRRVQRLN